LAGGDTAAAVDWSTAGSAYQNTLVHPTDEDLSVGDLGRADDGQLSLSLVCRSLGVVGGGDERGAELRVGFGCCESTLNVLIEGFFAGQEGHFF
jgi:hypothetical protein